MTYLTTHKIRFPSFLPNSEPLTLQTCQRWKCSTLALLSSLYSVFPLLNMLPGFLAGSYKRYKEDTALFTTWLANAAAACGYKPKASKYQRSEQSRSTNPLAPTSSKVPSNASLGPALPSTGRLKGKERKAAKEAAKDAASKAKEIVVDTSDSQEPSTVRYTITTVEMLRQAEAVTQSTVRPRLQMPASLRIVVERAIRARQRCLEWFQKSEVDNKHADKQHAHFIEVLKKSLKILEPCVEAEGAELAQINQDKSSIDGSDSLTNRFMALEVEESLDDDPFENTEVAAAVKEVQKTKASKDGPVIATYELEDEDDFDEDLAFIIFCKCPSTSDSPRLTLSRFLRGPSSHARIHQRALAEVPGQAM